MINITTFSPSNTSLTMIYQRVDCVNMGGCCTATSDLLVNEIRQ